MDRSRSPSPTHHSRVGDLVDRWQHIAENAPVPRPATPPIRTVSPAPMLTRPASPVVLMRRVQESEERAAAKTLSMRHPRTLSDYEQQLDNFGVHVSQMTITPSIKVRTGEVPTPPVDPVNTYWPAILLTAGIAFLIALEHQLIEAGGMQYMMTIDSETSIAFFASASSISRIFHMFATIIFSYWAMKSESVRLPLLTGRYLSLAACFMYLLVEILPSDRRIHMCACWMLLACGNSSSALLRAFLARVSSQADRMRAFAVLTGAHVLAIVLIPMLQLSVAAVPYPGAVALPFLKFHSQSIPIWIALLLNGLSLFVVHRYMVDLPAEQKNDAPVLPLHQQVLFDLSTACPLSLVPLLAVAWLCKAIAGAAVVSMQSVTPLLLPSYFGMDPPTAMTTTVFAMLAIVGFAAALICAIALLPAFGWLSPRLSFFLSLAISLVVIILSYPYAVLQLPIAPFNATAGVGCNPAAFPWCASGAGAQPILYLGGFVAILGLGLPLASIGLDTVYSKMLGTSDQNLLQSALTVAEDLMLLAGPLYATTLFSLTGLPSLWIVNLLLTLIGALLFLIFWPHWDPRWEDFNSQISSIRHSVRRSVRDRVEDRLARC